MAQDGHLVSIGFAMPEAIARTQAKRQRRVQLSNWPDLLHLKASSTPVRVPSVFHSLIIE